MSMKSVYVVADNIISSLGFSTAANIQSIRENKIGIRQVLDESLYASELPLSLIDLKETTDRFQRLLKQYRKKSPSESFSRLEKLFILSIHDALSRSEVNPRNDRTILVISSTKGNIDLLENRHLTNFNHKRLYLWEMARIICNFFGFANTPLIVSNACISGLLAIIMATRYIQSGRFDHAVVAGGDIVSEFVISGFQSFQALSPAPCKPFDLNRNGLSLGEAAGTIILSSSQIASQTRPVYIASASTSNDANHISGPSKTGEELSLAIDKALRQASVLPGEVDYICAHGTATLYNDEMESKAIGLSSLPDVPVNSYKGYWGHCLGAAGLIEGVASVHALIENQLFRSAGFEVSGTPIPINVISGNQSASLSTCLKIASGFGGCNAAIIFRKG